MVSTQIVRKLLVTGGAGFIGSNFIRHSLRVQPERFILNLDKLTYAGNPANIAEFESNGNYGFVCGDVTDSRVVEDLLDRGIDGIIHFAAETHVDRSIADAREFVRTNVQGTYTLLEAARRKGVPRFVHVSTDEVYGSLKSGEVADENFPVGPNSPYAASKAASDLLVRSFWQTYRFPAVITRCSNNYGPFQFPEKLIPLMITNALEDRKLPVYGDGLNERDWIFVEDHCRALDRVLAHGRAGEIYNIGAAAPVSNLEIVRRLLKALNKPEELIEFVDDRPGHDRRYALDTRKIGEELGWEPTMELDEGLAETVKWYRTHTGWVENAKSGEYRDYYEKFYVKRHESLARM